MMKPEEFNRIIIPMRDELIGLANRLGGKDNISCIVLGRSMAESTEIDARPRNFLSRWLHSRKH